jgi:hypothetical protein
MLHALSADAQVPCNRSLAICYERYVFHARALNKKRSPVLAVVGLPAGMATAVAQTYPSHPITMIVPFVAGGPMDTVARVVADGMRASLGQPVPSKSRRRWGQHWY